MVFTVSRGNREGTRKVVNLLKLWYKNRSAKRGGKNPWDLKPEGWIVDAIKNWKISIGLEASWLRRSFQLWNQRCFWLSSFPYHIKPLLLILPIRRALWPQRFLRSNEDSTLRETSPDVDETLQNCYCISASIFFSLFSYLHVKLFSFLTPPGKRYFFVSLFLFFSFQIEFHWPYFLFDSHGK